MPPPHSLRRRLHLLMEGGRQGYGPARIFDAFLFVLIFGSAGLGAWSTVPSAADWVRDSFAIVEKVALGAFTIEYLLRLWACVEIPSTRYRDPIFGRLRFALSPLMLVDLAVLLPFYLSFLGFAIEPELLLVMRILRVVKLFRTVTAFETIAQVIWNERRSIMAMGLLLLSVVMTVSTLAYLAEHRAQPEKFSSIPAAAYWAISTLTTVGYGDVTPITPFGQFLAGVTSILGILALAIPSAVIVSGFVDELKRRDLAITWRLVASLPLFARISIEHVAHIAALLERQRIEAGRVIYTEEDPADAMYFIVTGEVDVSGQGQIDHLRDGEFFGERGLLDGGRCGAVATARVATDLLVLKSDQFRRALNEFPNLRERIIAQLEERKRGAATVNAAQAAL